jgi:predicted ABC-type ATPase
MIIFALMETKNFYIIAGCNGAGKTTASFTILPEYLNCVEFVNADEIARGLSPFNPQDVAIDAGRIMLKRIEDLMNSQTSFAVETTLSSKIYKSKIQEAKGKGYKTTLVFFWLNSSELAINRVKTRVAEGGHNIPTGVIERRYQAGIVNLFDIYFNLVNDLFIFDNSNGGIELVFKKINFTEAEIVNSNIFSTIKNQYNGYK